MMTARKKHRGLVYLRRSWERQETSLEKQPGWALDEAKKLGVAVDATLEDLHFMQANRLHSHKAIRLDDAVTGADLQRPGLLALINDVPGDEAISHIFTFKRDRLGRPQSPLEMMVIEEGLRRHGITIVRSDGVSSPPVSDDAALAEWIMMLFEYHRSGKFLRHLAEQMIWTQLYLAKKGFWTGGNASYGFVRALMNDRGEILEELPRGKRVRQRSKVQRGVPRTRDPARYPLSCRVIDLSNDCGAVMYGHTSGQRRVYTCGRYMATGGAVCGSNTVDAEALLRFTLDTLWELTDRLDTREKLRQKLMERALREQPEDPLRRQRDRQRAQLPAAVCDLERNLGVARRNYATEEDPMLREMLREELRRIQEELDQAQAQLAAIPQSPLADRCSPEEEVEAALSLLEDIRRVADNPGARAQIINVPLNCWFLPWRRSEVVPTILSRSTERRPVCRGSRWIDRGSGKWFWFARIELARGAGRRCTFVVTARGTSIRSKARCD